MVVEKNSRAPQGPEVRRAGGLGNVGRWPTTSSRRSPSPPSARRSPSGRARPRGRLFPAVLWG